MQSHDQGVRGEIGRVWEVSQVFGFGFCHQQPLEEQTRARSWGGRAGKWRSLTFKAEASEATWVTIFGSTKSE